MTGRLREMMWVDLLELVQRAGILYGSDLKDLGGRDYLSCVCESSSPAAWYLLSGVMIKCSQQ